MELRFIYTLDRRCKWISAIYVALLAAIFAAVALCVEDGYMRAWVFSLPLAVAALYVLSIPRYISVSAEKLEIHCVVEMTRIEICDIASIRIMEKQDYDRTFPVLGSYGFFGYYGYYLDLRKWDMIKMYASRRQGLVEITDISEQVFVVSCRDAKTLVEAVQNAKNGIPVVKSNDDKK